MIYWISDPHNTVDARNDSGVTTSTPIRRSSGEKYRTTFSARLIAIGAFLAWFIFDAVRLAFVATHPWPRLPINSELTVHSEMAYEISDFCLTEGDKLVEVNGISISNIRELLEAERRSSRGPVVLKFAGGTNSGHITTVIWTEFADNPGFEFGAPATLLTAPGLSGEYAGATVVAVNGQPVNSVEEIEAALNDFGWRKPSLLLRNTNEQDLVLVYKVMDWSRYFTSLIVGLAIGACAIGVIWVRGWSTGAWAYFWFATNLALFAIARAIPFDDRWTIEQIAYLLSQACLPCSSIAFLFNMTPLRNLAYAPINLRGTLLFTTFGSLPAFFAYRSAKSWELHEGALLFSIWLWLFPVALALVIDRLGRMYRASPIPAYLSFGIALSLAMPIAGLLIYPPETAMGILPYPVFVAWQLWMLAIVIAGLASEVPVRLMRLPLSSVDRQRAHLLRLACLCSFLPMSVYTLIETSTLSGSVTPRLLVELAQVAFPALLAIGIVRQNVLDLSRLVREAIATIALLVSAIVGYAILWTVAMPTLSDIFEAPYAVYSAGFTVLTAGLFALIHFLLNRYSSKGRFRSGAYEEDFFLRLHEVSAKADSVNDIHDFVSKEFSEHLQIPATHLILDSSELLNPVASGAGADATEVWSPESTAAGDLLRQMKNNEGSIYTSDLEERSTRTPAGVFDALQEIGVSVGVPLKDEGQLVGALLVGKNERDPNFSSVEVAFVTQTARRLGVSLRAASQRAARPTSRIVDLFPAFPKEIAGFRIQRTLGQGGTSFVYLGMKNNRPAAIKVANHSVQASPALRSRFTREAQILRELQHAHVLEMIDHGQAGNEPYIALEYMPGGSLRDRLERGGPLTDISVASVLCQAAEALAFAVEKRIIHRDIKPGNLYVAPSGAVKLADFGSGRIEDDDQFTFTGERLGTLAYMSPEALMGDEPDWQSDQYALGISAYELLMGHRPFEGRSLGAQIAAKRGSPSIFLKPLSAQVGVEFASIIVTMIAPRPDHRFKSYEELRRKLLDLFDPLLASPKRTII